MVAMAEKEGKEPETVPPPVGTLFVMTVYIAVIAGMWGAMFWALVGR
jgi:hypothetical protein